jgi:hypothetical protein
MNPLLRFRILILPLAFLLLAASAPPTPTEDPASLVRQMIAKARSISTLSYNQSKWERINGRMHLEVMFVKVNRNPFKVYLKQSVPRSVEVLYVTGQNNGKAVVNAGSLIPNLNLALDGNQLRENQHHNLLSSGFDELARLFEHLITKYGANSNMARLDGTETIAGRPCWKVVLENPNFGFTTYTVQANENVLTIARKLYVCEHMIMENNPSVSDFWSVRPGQTLKVPTDYGKRAELWLDQQTYLPMKVMVYDHLGLYERYDYTNVRVNPTFQADEFSTSFSVYGF